MNPAIFTVLHDNLARFYLDNLTTQSPMELLIADFDALKTEEFLSKSVTTKVLANERGYVPKICNIKSFYEGIISLANTLTYKNMFENVR